MMVISTQKKEIFSDWGPSFSRAFSRKSQNAPPGRAVMNGHYGLKTGNFQVKRAFSLEETPCGSTGFLHCTGNASNIRQLFGEIDSGIGLQGLIRLI
jgi:hypothetical protein